MQIDVDDVFTIRSRYFPLTVTFRNALFVFIFGVFKCSPRNWKRLRRLGKRKKQVPNNAFWFPCQTGKLFGHSSYIVWRTQLKNTWIVLLVLFPPLGEQKKTNLCQQKKVPNALLCPFTFKLVLSNMACSKVGDTHAWRMGNNINFYVLEYNVIDIETIGERERGREFFVGALKFFFRSKTNVSIQFSHTTTRRVLWFIESFIDIINNYY